MKTKIPTIIKLTFIVIFLNTVIESFLLFTEDRTLIISVQLLLNGILFYRFFILSRTNIQKPKLSVLTFTIIIYFIVLSLFSSNMIVTFNYLIKFLIPFFYLLIGYSILNKPDYIGYFIRKSWFFLAYFSIYIIIVNVLGIGESFYKGGIKMGYYSLNGIYVPTFSIIVIIYNLKMIKSKIERYFSILFSITSIIILILLLKRTLVILIFVSFIFYFFKKISLIRILRITLFSILFLVVFSNFSYLLEDSIASRKGRFDKEYDVTNEGRFVENIKVYALMKDSPLKLLFGTGEVFNDRMFLSKSFDVDREAHNSYIRIFWNGGFVGLLLFLSFYYKQFTEILKNFYTAKKLNNFYLLNLFYFGCIFILLRFFNDFSSGITYLGYNAFSYLLIGSILRIGKEYKVQIATNKTNTK